MKQSHRRDRGQKGARSADTAAAKAVAAESTVADAGRTGTGHHAVRRIALYAGSFDPVTVGHEDLIRRVLSFADSVVVAVANNVHKQPLFPVEMRLGFLRETLGDDPRIEIRSFSGLLVDFAREVKATVNIRGLRAVSDFEYEFQMALMNRHLYPELETLFMAPSLGTTYISSSMVREVARFGGDVSGLVHPVVRDALAHHFGHTG